MTDSIVIKGALLSQKADHFLTEVEEACKTAATTAKKSPTFKQIFRVALAGESVLSTIRSRKLCPEISAIRNTSRRVPVLIALGQIGLAKVELRRLLELTFWVVYFTHHPREWDHFDGKRQFGFTRDVNKPIGYAAHRDLSFYFSYALEYMESEPSGQAMSAINILNDVKKQLNASVHAGQIARQPSVQIPFDRFAENDLQQFLSLQKLALANSIILLLAFDRRTFDSLQAGPRAYFDWLIDANARRNIRKGPFGLSLL
jgi:hypothetical protein